MWLSLIPAGGSLLLVLVVGLMPPSRLAGAQEPTPAATPGRAPTFEEPRRAGPPPEVGPPILEDALAAPGVIWPASCPTGRGGRSFVGEGLVTRISGRCTDASTSASGGDPIARLSFPDGEVRIEVRAVSGLDRASFGLFVRAQPNVNDGYYLATIEPARGHSQLYRWSNGAGAVLAERGDLAGVVSPDGWNSVAVRAQGPNLWLLINDQVALSAVDQSLDRGTVWLSVARLGNLDDNVESAVVMRNLRISLLANGDPTRAASYAIPPGVAEVLVDEPLTAAGALQSGVCPTQRNDTQFVAQGFQMRVRGKCREENTLAEIRADVRGLTLPDGEIHTEALFPGAGNRAVFRIFFHTQANEDGYGVSITPADGRASLFKWSNGAGATLAVQNGLGGLFKPGDWNSVAVRVQGPNLWVLLNDQPVLLGVDSTFDTGGVAMDLLRLGEVNDQQEVTVILRNLRISRLAS
jgi:3-keto-disaccharide hydrolase